jgi:hypothetical protein
MTDVLAPELPEPQPEPRRTAGTLLALWVGVLALLGGGIFAVLALAGDDAGTPEEAVQRLFRAAADEDVLGALAALPPSERDPMREAIPQIAQQLQRLDILSSDFSLEKIKGVDLDFSQLDLTSRPIGDGVAAVTIRGGRASYRVVPSDLPLGNFLKDLVGDLPTEPQTGSDTMKSEGEDDQIVTIKEDGRWYVSLNYSVAEQLRRQSGAKVPAFGKRLQPTGARSPEQAVEQLIGKSLALDVEAVIALLPPDEGRVVRDYAPLFIDDAKQAAADVDFDAQLKSLDVDTARDGGRAVVSLKAFDVTYTAEGKSGEVIYDGKCVTVKAPDIPPDQGRLCPDNPDIPAPIADLAGRFPNQGIVTVQRDGAWFVSPTRTLFDGLVGVLKAVDRKDLEELKNFFGGTESGVGTIEG